VFDSNLGKDKEGEDGGPETLKKIPAKEKEKKKQRGERKRTERTSAVCRNSRGGNDAFMKFAKLNRRVGGFGQGEKKSYHWRTQRRGKGK